MSQLPTDKAERKAAPMAEGLLWYFPAALAAVAHVSKVGNDQHNPGEPMHHARGKSTDHADCIMRHMVDAGEIDTDGIRHSAKVAWRALALLQEELEEAHDLDLPRNARAPERSVTVELKGPAFDTWDVVSRDTYNTYRTVHGDIACSSCFWLAPQHHPDCPATSSSSGTSPSGSKQA